jgi:DNA-binding winged helix-turn-helix (wHTH) protein/Tol biopolymer transport system component
MTADERYTFGPYLLDVPTRALLRDGESLALTSKVFDTLLALVRNRDRVVAKEELLQLVWPDAFVSEDSLTQSVSVLRRVLGDRSGQPQFIATVPRRGYRFVAAVEPILGADETTETLPAVIENLIETTATPVNVQLEEPPRLSPPSTMSARPFRRRWPLRLRSGQAAAAVVMLAIAATIVLTVRTGTTVPRGVVPTGSIRFILDPPQDNALASGAALSPDGRYLTFVAREQGSGRPKLWVRSLESPDLHVLPGTEGAFRPFWAPTSDAIGFFAGGRLKHIRVDGTALQMLASVGSRPSGGSWSSRGVIVFADRQSQIFAIPATGGDPKPLTTLDQNEQQVAHQTPSFLPDGNHFLYFAAGTTAERSATYVGALDSTERVRLLDGTASSAIYAPPGYVLFVRDGVLMAQRFDTSRLRLTGAPVSLAQSAAQPPDVRVGVISASTTGLLTFGGDAPSARLVWVARDGRQLNAIDAPVPLHNPTMSPDQRYIAADASINGPRSGIWLIDIARGAPVRFSDGIMPSWGPRGSQLSYTVPRGAGYADIMTRSITGPTAGDTTLVAGPQPKIPGNWAPDGQLVFATTSPQFRLDLWRLPAGSRTAVPYLQTPFNELHGQVSPDGRWIAYTSDESGNWEVYLQTFPTPGGKRVVSIGGGGEPLWRKDGRELYYLASDGTLMAVDITNGPSLQVGRPRALFRAPITADLLTYRNQYAADADGQRFLFDSPGEREPINVVVNWNALANP